MTDHPSNIPELSWLTETSEQDDSWYGPGPALVNLHSWMQRLFDTDHRCVVTATYAAASVSLPHWESWFESSPEFAIESIVDGQPPTVQLAAVSNWLNAPTSEYKNQAFETVDHTKQLHWFHEEYEDSWFDYPGMWSVEASDFCVLSLTGDPYSPASIVDLAIISVMCAINSFRNSIDDDIRDPAIVVLNAIRAALEK
ncbi:hypothetical protein [Bremerella sp.]|uniref:hypothetical protein n=1 Tax=Bremerella sp. TaxID=2795602 RepID=UPI00391BE24A